MRSKIKWMFLCIIPALALLAFSAFYSVHRHIPIGNFTRDVAAIADINRFTGVISTAGILLWAATAGISLLSALLLWRRHFKTHAAFLLWSGMLTALLMLDDQCMIHEWMGERAEKWLYAFYGIVSMATFVRYRRIVLASEYGLLSIALMGFAASILVDQLGANSGWWYFAEDGPKFLGIACWFGYYARTSWLSLNKAMDSFAPSNRMPGEH